MHDRDPCKMQIPFIDMILYTIYIDTTYIYIHICTYIYIIYMYTCIYKGNKNTKKFPTGIHIQVWTFEHFARPQVLNKRALHSTCSSRRILSGAFAWVRSASWAMKNSLVGWLVIIVGGFYMGYTTWTVMMSSATIARPSIFQWFRWVSEFQKVNRRGSEKVRPIIPIKRGHTILILLISDMFSYRIVVDAEITIDQLHVASCMFEISLISQRCFMKSVLQLVNVWST